MVMITITIVTTVIIKKEERKLSEIEMISNETETTQ